MLLLLPVLTGFLLAASFPRFSQHYLAWIAFVPLLVFVVRAKTPLRAFWGGYIAGSIEFFILLVWMPEVLARYGGLVPGLAWTGYTLLILLLSCFPGLVCLAAKWLVLKGGDSRILLFPAVWVLVEFAQAYVPFGGFPWLSVGYSQTNWLSLIQIADLTGVYGVSFLVLWVSAAVFWLGWKWKLGGRAWAPIFAAALAVALCLGYGSVSMNRWGALRADYSVALLQGNLSPDLGGAALEDDYRSGYVHMADGLRSSNIDLVILPESPTPVIYGWDAAYRKTMEDLARRYRFGVIFNNIRSEESDGNPIYFNSAFYLDGSGSLAGTYDKMHLVPFGEYIPMKSLLVFLHTISRDVGEFHPGKNETVFRLGGHPVCATVCFEAIFPSLVRKFVRKGGQLLVNLTNDGWYGDSSAPFEHFAIARWRAVENRRYLLRAANTGISAVVEPTGRVQVSTGILQKAVCRGRFAFITQQTYYTRYGDVFILLCVIIVFSYTILSIKRGRKD